MREIQIIFTQPFIEICRAEIFTNEQHSCMTFLPQLRLLQQVDIWDLNREMKEATKNLKWQMMIAKIMTFKWTKVP